MGQYRQWLYYREVDQQLRDQQRKLRQRLQQLLQEANQHEQALTHYSEPAINNPLARALLAEHQHARAIAAIEQQAQPVSEPRKASASHTPPATSQPEPREVTPEPVSQPPLQRVANAPSLAIWGEALIPEPPAKPTTRVTPEPHVSPTPEQAPTRPIPPTPAKPASSPSYIYEEPMQAAVPAPAAPHMTPVDQQSERVNQLVKRWAQRWHREATQKHAPPNNNERR